MPEKSHRLTVVPAARTLAIATCTGIVVPRVITGAGKHAARRFLEFFAATIRNKNTRMAYYRAVCSFFAWCDQHRIGEIADIRAAARGGIYREPRSVHGRGTRPNTWSARIRRTRQ